MYSQSTHVTLYIRCDGQVKWASLPVADGLLVEFLEGHGLLAHVDGLEDAPVAGHHLADGVGDLERRRLHVDGSLPGHPLLGRDDLQWRREGN